MNRNKSIRINLMFREVSQSHMNLLLHIALTSNNTKLNKMAIEAEQMHREVLLWTREVRSKLHALTQDSTKSSKPKNPDTIPHNKISVSTIIRNLLIQESDNRYSNVFLTMTSPLILKLAYETIKSKPGNMVKGTDHLTLDGITMDWFITTSLELRREHYKFKPARRVNIPKPNGKSRPLGISSPRDKIIQQAMRMVLE